MRNACWWGLVALACSAIGQAASLKPVAVDRFAIAPGEQATLQWRIEGEWPGKAQDCVIRDYADAPVLKGQAALAAPNGIEVAVRLAQGYYEVEFPATNQRFGLIVLPACQGKPDAFFAVDGALSWLVRDDAVRESLIKVAKRSGISMVRERLSWAGIHPGPGKWDWDGGARYDKLRGEYERSNLPILEMAHDAPAWPGRVAKYPQDLVATAEGWREIAQKWRSTWGALEIWNEPDIFFGGDLPADQYAALAKTIAYAVDVPSKSFDRVPVAGGVMAHCNEQFLKTLAENDTLHSFDVFTFHTYNKAPEMESLVAQYRDWLKKSGAAGMPLWITECGRPWKRGAARPPADQDATSALDITMKAVEARACGIARYFAFVYPYYEENENNFGMMGREATPLRSMGAYAQMAHALAGLDYLGDLRVSDKAFQRARVFGNDQTAVAVLYTGRTERSAKAKLDVSPVRVEGIDGRAIRPEADGAISVSDGLIYAWLDRRGASFQLAEKGGEPAVGTLNSRPRAMQLQDTARKGPQPLIGFSHVVMRLQLDRGLLGPCSAGYRLKAPLPEKIRLVTRVFNLSGKDEELAFCMGTGAGESRPGEPQQRRQAIPANGFADISWDVDLRGADKGDLPVRIAARNAKDEVVSRLAFRLMMN
jgi:hypothetical protein